MSEAPGTSERRTMTTFRREDGEPIGDYDFVLDIEYLDDDAEWSDGPVTYICERWVLERSDRLTLPICNDMACDMPAIYWGLCEKHAREDDPDAFTDPPLSRASVSSGPKEDSDG